MRNNTIGSNGGYTHTFDALDLGGTKTGECPLVLGPRDASRANGALDVDNRSSR